MKRLYFRMMLGVLIVLILTFSLPPLMFRAFEGPERRPPLPNLMRGSAEFLASQLDKMPLEQAQKTIDSLQVVYNHPLRLVDISDPDTRHEMMAEGDPRFHRPENTDRHIVHVILPNLKKILILGPVVDSPHFSDTGRLLRLVALVLIIAGGAGFIMVAPVARNLRALESAALQFGQGNLNSRASVQTSDAVGSVARCFNQMADSIQQLIQRERQLLQSVSHELRTPISRIRFSLTMLNDAATQEEREQRSKEIDGEITEIDRLVGELLDYNRFQSESFQLKKQSFAILPVLQTAAKRLQDFRPEVKLDINPLDDPDRTVFADQLSFRRAVENLLSNCLRFAKTQVVIDYFQENGVTVVRVSEDGPGIPEDRRKQVFVPFFQGEASRNTDNPQGVGLGLAIVKRILELHKGIIEIDKADIGGARFTTYWPPDSESKA